MRDLVFKNLTSNDKRRRIITTSEVAENKGVRSVIRRHFLYGMKEFSGSPASLLPPHLYIRKERNTMGQRETFYCKIRGNICAVYNGKPYLVQFLHSLRINFSAIPLGSHA
jgi:hypothetical protein